MQKKSSPKLCSKKTDWGKFEETLKQKISLESPIETEKQIDLETRQLITNVQQATKTSIPFVSIKVSSANKYPVETRRLVLEKRKARKKWHLTRYQSDKIKFNRLNNF